MRVASSQPGACRLGFAGPSADVILREAAPRRAPRPDDAYWKIGLAVPSVDVAAARLGSHGIDVSAPTQFLDVGYLCHLADPDGHEIELLQHHFEENHRPRAIETNHPLGTLAILGQITLRVSDTTWALGFYRDALGMRLLSRQPIAPHRFTLHFLAYTDETPPIDDLEATGNREWLWQRPYTTLELQERWDGPRPTACAHAGFGGIEIESDQRTELQARVDAHTADDATPIQLVDRPPHSTA